jgi:hypothetical protein
VGEGYPFLGKGEKLFFRKPLKIVNFEHVLDFKSRKYKLPEQF